MKRTDNTENMTFVLINPTDNKSKSYKDIREEILNTVGHFYESEDCDYGSSCCPSNCIVFLRLFTPEEKKAVIDIIESNNCIALIIEGAVEAWKKLDNNTISFS